MKRYNPKELEPRWQRIWDETGVYTADLQSNKPKYIAMSMFNYPSGAGIHIGHAMNYTISDVKARFKRQQGYESYHPVGWDAFGLPAENYAIKAGVSPQESMATIIPGYHKQYKAMGWSNDWEKEIATHLPEYYKWTQWIFTQMYKHGLAYRDSRMQWWCTKCQTVLANEQVIDGKCWRHDGADDPLVEKKEVKQWFFKITDYADELLEAIEDLDWTDTVKLAQKNWIGKSTGAEIDFAVANQNLNFVILHGYTGRADKNFIPWLKDSLEARGYKVQAPQLPNTDKPVESEQVNYVLEHCDIDEHTVLVGHSLGGAVAMKVLQQLTKPIKQLVLVAPVVEPAFRPAEYDRPFLDTFDFTYDYEQLVKKASSRIVLSDTLEADERKPYLTYLAGKIAADFIEFTAEKRHVTGDTEPKLLEVLVPSVTVFTTRPDTLFGATFLVLAPEHELVAALTTDAQKTAVDTYVKAAQKKSELERQTSKEKTGVFTGAYAVNPVNGQQIPIWVADYVLVGYGTGAIMAVPAHDERDYEFAQKFDLPIQQVFMPIANDSHNPPRDGFENVRRDTVIVHLRDKSTGKFALLDWHESLEGITTAIMGGIDAGQTAEEAAKTEILEEAGLKDVKIIKTLRWITGARYCASHKQQNRTAVATVLLAEIEDLKGQFEIDEKEKKQHTLVWVNEDKVLGRLVPDHQKFVWEQLHKETAITGEGEMLQAGEYDGLSTSDARENIVKTLAQQGKAVEKVNYKMRDWSVSRQRYWGAPIPIINCAKCGPVLVPDAELPVVLPELDDFQPSGDGRSALARATDWMSAVCPECGGPGERETDTLDTYICSSWYMYRYFDPHNQQAIFDSKLVKKWEPIDFYNGADHATAHLLYARFIGHFFKTLGLVNEPEPFKQFLFNGKVTASDGTMFSKSKGNGVDPLEIIGQGYGADALRTYLMFAAPLDMWIRWDPQGVPGAYRFLSRIWTLVHEYLEAPEKPVDETAQRDIRRVAHATIRKMTEDIEENRYNTAIAAAMTAVNDLYKLKVQHLAKSAVWQEALSAVVACVAPFAPHIADELWLQLGHHTSVHRDTWPAWDAQYITKDVMTIAVQVNGKLRATIEVPADADEQAITAAAQANDKVQVYLAGHEIVKTIYVPKKLVSFVVK